MTSNCFFLQLCLINTSTVIVQVVKWKRMKAVKYAVEFLALEPRKSTRIGNSLGKPKHTRLDKAD